MIIMTAAMMTVVVISSAVPIAMIVILLHGHSHQREDFAITGTQGILATNQRGEVNDVAAYSGRRGQHTIGPDGPKPLAVGPLGVHLRPTIANNSRKRFLMCWSAFGRMADRHDIRRPFGRAGSNCRAVEGRAFRQGRDTFALDRLRLRFTRQPAAQDAA